LEGATRLNRQHPKANRPRKETNAKLRSKVISIFVIPLRRRLFALKSKPAGGARIGFGGF
jgi:hypothetical protein